jgi:hypothetical protein
MLTALFWVLIGVVAIFVIYIVARVISAAVLKSLAEHRNS